MKLPKALLFAAVALVGVLAGLLLWQPTWGDRLIAEPAMPRGGDFTLNTAQGTFNLATQRGKVVWIYFGYTYCPDFCPTTLAAMAQTLKTLSADDLAQVQPVLVSLDPQRDTPEHLARYVQFFHPKFLGATGNAQQLAEITARYGVVFAVNRPQGGESNYAVDHSTSSYLIDTQGKLATILPGAAPLPMATAALRQLLRRNPQENP